MSTSKYIDKICCAALIFSLIMSAVLINVGKFDIQPVNAAIGYASRLFNISKVHTIDIVMDDWDSFIESCTDEKYTDCTVIIDGEAYRNVGIRAKGNTSLMSVAAYGNDRYSFKIEFDHYDNALNYYGLDKLCLNNIIQDHTYMKDYISYQLMNEFGVDAPLCSYTYITVNGEDWGLYLAVEGVEESFLQRSYGSDYGQLYKPDSMKLGGGRGNGRAFNAADFDPEHLPPDMPSRSKQDGSRDIPFRPEQDGNPDMPFKPEQDSNPDMPFNPEQDDSTDMPFKPKQDGSPNMPFKPGAGNSDVSLIYTDDAFDSYQNIFDNAKTNLTNADKTRLITSLRKLNLAEDLENVVDIDEVIRYFVVHNFVLNFDSYTGSMIHNYYLYEEDGQLSMIPWDYNLAFGGFEAQSDSTSLVNYPIDTPVSGGTVDSRPMLAWILNNDEYTELYHQYFSEYITVCFENGYFENMIDSVKEMIAPYVESDPTKFCTYEEFEQGVSTLKEFCVLRATSISGQLDGTIPATADGQAADNTSLIKADHLTISDMGEMDLKRR